MILNSSSPVGYTMGIKATLNPLILPFSFVVIDMYIFSSKFVLDNSTKSALVLTAW